MTNIADFDTFDDVENPELRTWNRCATIFNIGKDHGPQAMQEYSKQLSVEARKECSEMFERVEKSGYEATRAQVIRNNQPYAIN